MANDLFKDVDWSKCTKKRKCCSGSENEGQYYDVEDPCVQGARLDPTTCNCVPEGVGDYRLFVGTWRSESHTWNCSRNLPRSGVPTCNIFNPVGNFFNIQLLDVIVRQGTGSTSCCEGTGTAGEPFCPVAIKYIELSPTAPKERYKKEFTDCLISPLMGDGAQGCTNSRSTSSYGGFVTRVLYWPGGDMFTPGSISYDLGISSPPGCSN